MTHYSEEFKASIIAKMLPPNNVGVPQLEKETGISRNTLYTWRIQHRKSQDAIQASRPIPGELSSEEKFTAVIESASLNEVELSEYCRRKGLYPGDHLAFLPGLYICTASVLSLWMLCGYPAKPVLDEQQAGAGCRF